jgi:hypothetical protein
LSTLNTRFLEDNDYNSWYSNYISLCEDKLLDHFLKELKDRTILSFEGKDESWYLKGYAEGKWSPITLLEHIIDTEIIFTTRLLACLRGSSTNWPGFDENEFANNGQAHNTSLKFQLNRYQFVRENTLLMCELINDSNYANRMIADGKEFTSLSLMAVIAGHNAHHLNVLTDRYPSN